MMQILSTYQARPLLAYKKTKPQDVSISLDLGLTEVEVTVSPAGVKLPDGELSWQVIEAIAEDEVACYLIENGEARKIQFFSESFNRLYSLMPTQSAPTMLVSGIPMHRIKGTDPYQDTLTKIKAVKPLFGRILDTSTGLGYTAIEAAKSASSVITVELDPVVLELCWFNPWSRELFDNPKIEQRIGDVWDEVERFSDGYFSHIIHDPPVISLAGHLYSGDFYRELHRVLKPNGRLFHYVGDPTSRSGKSNTRGVMNRLRQAGFKRVEAKPRAYGVVAYKSS